ncbi:MAG: hypothetical protein HGA99_02845 [Chlorobiaceae bacterium]|nr:hypothetical protein [Chlorobiaceae bacterium]
MTTVLLLAVVLLLLAVLFILLTGWPGRVQKEIEHTGMELRRELSQHRADSLQLLHAMRIELEESLRETIEQKLDAVAVDSRRTAERSKKPVPVQSHNPLHDEEEVEAEDDLNGRYRRRNGSGAGSAADDRQLMLFSVTDERQEPVNAVPVESAATIFCDIDDIPGVEDLADYEDL